MKYYVYEWFNVENNEVFYVGKGTNRRYLTRNRNSKFNEYILNNKVDVRIIKRFEIEQDSFDYEEKLIAEYKLKGQCSCNLHFGGNGGVSEMWTDEMKERMSIFNPMKNPEIASKVNGQKKKIPVINGEEFEDVKKASEYYNVCTTTIWRWCKRGYDTKGNKCHYKGETTQGSLKTTNSKMVEVDGIEFKSVREASKHIGVWPETLIKAIKNNRKCKGHECKYVNQQPS